jgi:hypothetical protein
MRPDPLDGTAGPEKIGGSLMRWEEQSWRQHEALKSGMGPTSIEHGSASQKGATDV